MLKKDERAQRLDYEMIVNRAALITIGFCIANSIFSLCIFSGFSKSHDPIISMSMSEHPMVVWFEIFFFVLVVLSRLKDDCGKRITIKTKIRYVLLAFVLCATIIVPVGILVFQPWPMNQFLGLICGLSMVFLLVLCPAVCILEWCIRKRIK